MQHGNADQDEEVDSFGINDDDGDMDYLPDEDASDIENELVIEPNEIFGSDEEHGVGGMQAAQPQSAIGSCFHGKDGTKWNKDEPAAAVRMRQRNIMRFQAVPKHQNSIPIEVFKKFFTPNISFIIIAGTNRYAEDAVEKWNGKNSKSEPRVWNDWTSTELDAFIGILLAMGLTHSNMQNTKVLWRSNALPIFRAAMSHKRFLA